MNFLGDLDPMKSLSRLSVNSLRLFTIFEEEKVLDVIDDDQSSEHRQLGNINQSHCYSLFFDEFFYVSESISSRINFSLSLTSRYSVFES